MPVTLQHWSEPPDRLQLIPETVDVWLFSLNQPSARLDKMRKLLSPDELVRAERFIQQSAGEQYVTAHGILRILLSRYLNSAPESIAFKQDIHGKPLLAARPDNASASAKNDVNIAGSNKMILNFNLSHSHEVGLIAISPDRAVGVDIEYLKRDFEYMKIARRFYTPAEYDALEKTPGPLQKKAFFSGWCRKEAILKALGTGLSGGLGNFDVGMSTEPHAEIIELPEHLQFKAATSSSAKWCAQDLPAVDSYALAIAAEKDDWSLRCFSW